MLSCLKSECPFFHSYNLQHRILKTGFLDDKRPVTLSDCTRCYVILTRQDKRTICGFHMLHPTTCNSKLSHYLHLTYKHFNHIYNCFAQNKKTFIHLPLCFVFFILRLYNFRAPRKIISYLYDFSKIRQPKLRDKLTTTDLPIQQRYARNTTTTTRISGNINADFR